MMNKFIVGLKRNPIKLVVSIFITYSICWTILEPILGMVKSAEIYLVGWNKYIFLLLISICVGIYRVIPTNEISINYNNSKIKIVFGDLFQYEGFKAIPVSRFFFETEVVISSLQHIVIDKFYKNSEGVRGLENYKEKLSNALQDQQFEIVRREILGQDEKYYKLGTTACINLNENNEFLLFAITKTEMRGHIPEINCNSTKMWIALDKFWNEARKHSRGKSINIPLIGSGITGINLSPIRILELNLLSILNSITEKGQITANEIRIILHNNYFDQIDLSLIEKTWKTP